jgi:hypothetical protein
MAGEFSRNLSWRSRRSPDFNVAYMDLNQKPSRFFISSWGILIARRPPMGPLFAFPFSDRREQVVPLRFWLFIAIAGGLAHLVLFIADRQISAGVDRLAELPAVHRSIPETDPNLKLVSEHSPYMRNER